MFKSESGGLHACESRPTAHQNKGLSQGRQEQLAKFEAWALGRCEPPLWLRPGPAADCRLRLASGS